MLTIELLNRLSKECGGRPNAAVVRGIVENQGYLISGKISTIDRLAAWCGQACVETNYFQTLKEIGGATYFKRYDGRKDLGNTEPGDGPRFPGRGVFQLTGRDNYASYGKRLGVDLIANPELAARPDISVRTSVLYWNDRKLSGYADNDDVKSISRAINRGSATSRKAANHEAERIRCTDIARKVLGASALLQPQGLLSKPPKKSAPAPEPDEVENDEPEVVEPIDLDQRITAKEADELAPPEADTAANPEVTKQVIVNETYTDDKRVRRAQEWLRNLGYTEVAEPDGKIGPFTKAAIRAYRADKGLPLGDYLDTEMFTMLAIDNEPRQLPKERTEATAKEIREKVPENSSNFITKITAYIGAAFSALVAAIKGIIDNIGDASAYLQPVKDFLGDIPPWAWTVAGIGMAAGFYFIGRIAARGEQASADAYKAGARR